MGKRNKKIKCPKCRGTNVVELAGQSRKKFSVGKTVAGGLLFGDVGAVVGGAVIGKKAEFEVVCLDCGHHWKLK